MPEATGESHTSRRGPTPIPRDRAGLTLTLSRFIGPFRARRRAGAGAALRAGPSHVAGIIASRDSTYRGVAHGLDRLVNGSDPYQLGFTYNGVPGAPDPVEVINTSFGGAASNDNEDDGDDVTSAFFGVSEALGAGNDNTNGSPTIGNIGRNTMSVAGYNDVGTVSSTDDVVLGSAPAGRRLGGARSPT